MSKLGKFSAAGAAVLCAFGAEAADLPAGCEEYRQLEYLDSNCNYLDTGICPDDNAYSCEVKYEIKQLSQSPLGNEAWVIGLISGAKWRVGGISGSPFYQNGGFVQTVFGTWYTAVSATSPSISGNMTVYLFAQNHDGELAHTSAKINLAYCRFGHNGETIRDYIPCIRKSDGKVGLYEAVSGDFLIGTVNAAGFLAGPLATSDFVMIGEGAVGTSCTFEPPASVLGDNDEELWYANGWTFTGASGATVSGSGKKQAATFTPSEPGVLRWTFKSDTVLSGTLVQYQEYEYLQAGYGVGIRTKYAPIKNRSAAEVKYRLTELTQDESYAFGVYCNYGGWWRTGAYQGKVFYSGFSLVEDAEGWTTASGTAPGNASGASTVGLFGQCESSSALMHLLGKVQLASCKVWEDGVLKLDLIPCKRVFDEIPGLYDRANGEFLTEANYSKNFTYGPAVPSNWVEMRGYDVGDVFTVTAPAAGGQNDAGDTRWSLVGWTFSGVDGSTRSGTDTTDFQFTYTVDGTLNWQYKIEYTVTASAGEGGSVEPTVQWVEKGKRGTIVATPAEGKFFGGWTGDVSAADAVMGNLALTVDGPKTIAATFSESSGTFVWTGAGEDALASNDANWQGGKKPTDMAAVVFGADGKGTNCTWDLDIPLVSWTQTEDYGGTVTIQTTFAETGFPVLRILGDCSILSGSWTHPSDCAGTQTYRLKASIGGNLTIGPDAKLDAFGLGFSKNGNNRYPTGLASTTTGCHGGIGGSVDAATGLTHLYDSITEPVNVGSGGSGLATWKGSPGGGGGAIYLTVGGKLTHNGVIDADANDGAGDASYLGSGGSIYVRAGTIEGTGTMTSCSQSGNYSGAGGRIAVVLTDEEATFDGYDIVRLASAYSKQAANKDVGTVGGCGTIYAETPANRKDHGWVILKNNGRALDPHRGGILCYGTNFEADYDKITSTNAAMIYVATGHTINLQHTTLDIDASDPNVQNGFHFAGGRVVLPEDAESFSFGYPVTLASTTTPVSGVAAWEVEDKGILRVTVSSTLDGSLVIDEGGKVYLDGHTLTIRSRMPKEWKKGGYPSNIDFGGTTENPGKILWQNPGLTLILE